MAVAFGVTVSRSAKFGSMSIGGVAQSLEANEIILFSQTLPANVTDAVVRLHVDVTTVVAMAIEADQDCTIKTNSDMTPQETFTLKAKQPLVWTEDDPGGICFFSDDVTALFVTTAPAAETTLTFGAGLDIVDE